MNKKGEGEVFVIFLVLMLAIAFISAIGNTDYGEYMKDCEKLNKGDFYYNATCHYMWNENNSYECNKTSFKDLKSFCQDKWDGLYLKIEEVNKDE